MRPRQTIERDLYTAKVLANALDPNRPVTRTLAEYQARVVGFTAELDAAITAAGGRA